MPNTLEVGVGIFHRSQSITGAVHLSNPHSCNLTRPCPLLVITCLWCCHFYTFSGTVITGNVQQTTSTHRVSFHCPQDHAESWWGLAFFFWDDDDIQWCTTITQHWKNMGVKSGAWAEGSHLGPLKTLCSFLNVMKPILLLLKSWSRSSGSI